MTAEEVARVRPQQEVVVNVNLYVRRNTLTNLKLLRMQQKKVRESHEQSMIYLKMGRVYLVPLTDLRIGPPHPNMED